MTVVPTPIAQMAADAPKQQTWPAPCTTPLLKDPACWLGPDMAMRREEWAVDLSEVHVAELTTAIVEAESRGTKMETITRAQFKLPTLGLVLQQVAKTVDDGRGFALLRGLPMDKWSESQARLGLWGIGTHLGTNEKQDAKGLMMHDVRDIAPKADNETLEQRMAKDSNIRGFQTNAALPYHTDGCDAFALCCVSKGETGGESLLISAPTVFNYIMEKRPDLAVVLQQPYHFDARGQRADGAKCQVHPIFTIHDGRVNILHKEPYIHTAQRFEDVPRLTAAQKEALDFLREVMDLDELALRFTLQKGEVIIASNHSALHGRSAFDSVVSGNEDAPKSRRHMLRLWVTIHGARELPPHYADTREYCDSYARRVAHSARVRVLDGSMGRHLLNNGLPSDGQLWSARALVDKQYHEMVISAHVDYIAAGADYITTNNYAVQPFYYRKAFAGDRWEDKLAEHSKLSAELARQARDAAGRPEVKVMGCLPPLAESHRPDITEDAYLQEGQAFFERFYKVIAEALVNDVDCFLAETHSTYQEMLCAVRAAAAVGKPVIVSMAAALRDRELKPAPSRAAVVAELVLQEVEQGRADIPLLSFNCGTMEQCSDALEAIPEGLRQRLRNAKIALGIYPNLNSGSEKRQSKGFDHAKQKSDEGGPAKKIARREDLEEGDLLCRFCDEWVAAGVTYIGACCGSTPDDIQGIAAHLKHHWSTSKHF